MHADTYTKAVLTVIAACLLWICVTGGSWTPVAAQGTREPQEVIIAGSRAPQEMVIVGSRSPVQVVAPPRAPLAVRPSADWYQEPLPVDAARPLPTKLTGIERGDGHWDPVDVTVKEQPKKAAPGY